jgi:hypothetical protein
MTSNVRHTFRPTLEALEGRLVPSFSWKQVNSPDFAAALTSFQWGVGRGITNAAVLTGYDIRTQTGTAVLTAARPAAASPPALGLTMPAGPTAVVAMSFQTITLNY